MRSEPFSCELAPRGSSDDGLTRARERWLPFAEQRRGCTLHPMYLDKLLPLQIPRVKPDFLQPSTTQICPCCRMYLELQSPGSQHVELCSPQEQNFVKPRVTPHSRPMNKKSGCFSCTILKHVSFFFFTYMYIRLLFLNTKQGAF